MGYAPGMDSTTLRVSKVAVNPPESQSKNNTGHTNLQQLLAEMSPEMREGQYVFLSFTGAGYGDHLNLKPLAIMQEDEGLTMVVPKHLADANQHHYDRAFRCITLQVHSSLEAVGLTAAFSKQLTLYGISANVIAGFYHDHIFVPVDDADKAVASLRELTQNK